MMAPTAAGALGLYMIEDSHAMQSALVDLFDTIGGIEVLGSAGTEVQATGWLHKHEGGWDVVTIDLMLDGGSGFHLIHRCRTQRDPGTIIVLSDFVSPAVERRCRELGADAVFKKSDTKAFADFVAQVSAERDAPRH